MDTKQENKMSFDVATVQSCVDQLHMVTRGLPMVVRGKQQQAFG